MNVVLRVICPIPFMKSLEGQIQLSEIGGKTTMKRREP